MATRSTCARDACPTISDLQAAGERLSNLTHLSEVKRAPEQGEQGLCPFACRETEHEFGQDDLSDLARPSRGRQSVQRRLQDLELNFIEPETWP
jgi:hypothetical protein